MWIDVYLHVGRWIHIWVDGYICGYSDTMNTLVGNGYTCGYMDAHVARWIPLWVDGLYLLVDRYVGTWITT